MPDVVYGNNTIQYTIEEKEGLKSHYISVQKDLGVILKGKAVPLYKADQMILKKARWILNKLELVKQIHSDEIVTGSRIPYLGRKYYAEVIKDANVKGVILDFNHSKFKFTINPSIDIQVELKKTIQQFYKSKAIDKITPRIRKWSNTTRLSYNKLKYLFLDKRWGSCTKENNIVININVIKLPFSIIDYVIVHELAHTKIKNHSKEYWAEISKHMPNWNILNEKLIEYRD
ncbi:DUF45 domain-containing protein [Mucilaginibacter sp. JRF]|uniref:M48 family metallopeptidase n=1 Tax=Mucilaginibacter sp. JRF TaxID=2780088 RepID=UPI001882FF0C|nr:YgjP-like metallopeptidase domain-containing protein [Mucilaginibacter sp. JRF]MBE9584631.1 DUF45 domain-containing protein [Mucilaginibacter sp. JRF]